MLARLWWLFDLLTHFRVHYTAASAALFVASLLMRRFGVAAAACAGLVVSAAPLVSYVSFPGSLASPSAETFRLVSFNVWFRNTDVARAAAYLEHVDADVVVIQEASALFAQELQALAPRYRHAHIARDRRGATILSQWPLLEARSASAGEGATPAAHVRVKWREAELTLIGVHLHWPLGARVSHLRNQELAALAQLASATQGPLLIAGDLNITPWSPHFRDLLRDSGLKDCAAEQGLASSWPSHVRWLGIRIDHCLASAHWQTLDVRTGPHVGSDHRAVIAELGLRTTS